MSAQPAIFRTCLIPMRQQMFNAATAPDDEDALLLASTCRSVLSSGPERGPR